MKVFRALMPAELAIAALSTAACDVADKPTEGMNANDIPENQGIGGTFDGNPSGTASQAGNAAAANMPAEDNSMADGTTPMQQTKP